jgi:formate-dependent nitrite reductase membrane component NrfD
VTPELFITRHNELVDPVVHVWSWQIPVYLFLGGWVAGMMVIMGYFLFRGRHEEETCVCGVLPLLSLTLLSVGMLALFLDLEHKLYVWRLYTTFEAGSPMSWGAWILLLVYPALAAVFALHPPGILAGLWPSFDRLSARLAAPRIVNAIAAANVVLGVGLGIYTGILLSSLGARPFWNSALLGPLFLVSGLSSAAAFTHLVARHPGERALLAKSDNVFLAVELFLVGLFLVGLSSASQAHADAAALVLGGPFTAVFWVLVVGFGIVVPLVIQVLAASHRIAHTRLAPIFVLAGGLALRFVIVLAGQYSHWPKA